MRKLIVGHSDIEVTMTIYAHVSLDEKRKALGKLGEALRCRDCCHRCRQSATRHKASTASPQFRRGGQGRGRTADLPLFRIKDHRAGPATVVCLPASVTSGKRRSTPVFVAA